MHDRDVVVVSGVRTPFAAAGTLFRRVGAAELARIAIREAVERAEIDPEWIEEVVVGSAAGSADAPNVARTASLAAKIPRRVPALSVSRDSASGFEAIVEAAYRIQSGDADFAVAAAVESISSAPLLWSREAREIWTKADRARGRFSRAAALARLRPRHFRPVPGFHRGLVDPVSGLRMGETADRLAREFDLSREEQDAFALRSHRLAAAAWADGKMAAEVMGVPIPPEYASAVLKDSGIRESLRAEDLAALPPAFDARYGSVTAGNAAPAGDGAVALVLASAGRAKALGLRVLGKVRCWGFAGCDPRRMGLGPVFAVPEALRRAGGLSLDRMDLVEIDEASAAQVVACLRAFESRSFCEQHLRTGPLGEVDPGRVNVNGGAIAFGDPVGAGSARLVLTLLGEMERRGASLGLAAVSVGGGQGAAMVLERV
jgi:acetyl-CoA C-acetyltransferase/acetyl-CoA acyltransferase